MYGCSGYTAASARIANVAVEGHAAKGNEEDPLKCLLSNLRLILKFHKLYRPEEPTTTCKWSICNLKFKVFKNVTLKVSDRQLSIKTIIY